MVVQKMDGIVITKSYIITVKQSDDTSLFLRSKIFIYVIYRKEHGVWYK